MFEDIEQYIKKSREERRGHLILDENCLEIGGHASTVFKGLLAHYLQTTIPTRKKIVLCHACNNERCSNPRHLYWGTYRDNYEDHLLNGYSTIVEKTKNKYGPDAYQILAKQASSKGGQNNRGIPKSDEHRRKISESLKRNSASVAQG